MKREGVIAGMDKEIGSVRMSDRGAILVFFKTHTKNFDKLNVGDKVLFNLDGVRHWALDVEKVKKSKGRKEVIL